MNLMQRLSPGFANDAMRSEGSFRLIRERILQALLLGIVSIGAIGITVRWLSVSRSGVNQPILYSIGFAWILIILFWRELPYGLRAGTIPLITLILAVGELFTSGLLGVVQFWLVTLTTVMALLFGFVPALICTAAGTLTILALGGMIQSHWVNFPFAPNFLLGQGWLLSGITLAVVSTGIASAASGLIHGMRNLLQEREELSAVLEKARGLLEARVEDRTRDIARRLAQVRTAAEISNVIARLNDPGTLYPNVVSLLQERLDLYYVGIFQVDDLNRYAVLRAGSGEAGQIMLARGHRLQIGGGSMIGWCIANHKPRIALDVGTDAVRFNNPVLPMTRSELALPILIRGEALGALTVQSDQEEAFDDDDILVLQGIADSLASALENSRLLAELKDNLEELRTLNRDYLKDAWTEVALEQGSLSYAYDAKTPPGANSTSIEVPVVLRDQTIARLTLDTTDPRMSPDDLAFLDALTTQTALALENARLVEETERRAEKEQKLNQLSSRFSRASDIETILKTAVEELGRLPGVAEVMVELNPGVQGQALDQDPPVIREISG